MTCITSYLTHVDSSYSYWTNMVYYR